MAADWRATLHQLLVMGEATTLHWEGGPSCFGELRRSGKLLVPQRHPPSQVDPFGRRGGEGLRLRALSWYDMFVAKL